jgi:hypothetical protein
MVIFDEIQDYKAGRSLQGQSMGVLLRGKEKCLCLTGTLNGGYADDLFHILFRMEPGRLRSDGFNYANSKDWLEAYGVVDWERKIDEKDSYYGPGRWQRSLDRPTDRQEIPGPSGSELAGGSGNWEKILEIVPALWNGFLSL